MAFAWISSDSNAMTARDPPLRRFCFPDRNENSAVIHDLLRELITDAEVCPSEPPTPPIQQLRVHFCPSLASTGGIDNRRTSTASSVFFFSILLFFIQLCCSSLSMSFSLLLGGWCMGEDRWNQVRGQRLIRFGTYHDTRGFMFKICQQVTR